MRGKTILPSSNFSSLSKTSPTAYWMKNSWIVLWTGETFENFHADGTKPEARD